jgi:nitrate/TMAO reductase-like tetraheme cytochrome c subunit
MEKQDNPDSKINKKNIAQTCGQSDCHTDQFMQYRGSAHDKAIKEKGNPDAPACNTCHGNHVILSAGDEKNPLSTSKGIVEVCSDCHGSNLITEKYNIQTKRVETYEESIHGIYVSFGDIRAANCASCHTNHNIRSENDPQSTIHPDNISVTCGQVGCHPNASAQFVKGKIHLDPKSKESGAIYYISSFFKYLTIGVLASLFGYMFLDFTSRIRKRKTVNKK